MVAEIDVDSVSYNKQSALWHYGGNKDVRLSNGN